MTPIRSINDHKVKKELKTRALNSVTDFLLLALENPHIVTWEDFFLFLAEDPQRALRLEAFAGFLHNHLPYLSANGKIDRKAIVLVFKINGAKQYVESYGDSFPALTERDVLLRNHAYLRELLSSCRLQDRIKAVDQAVKDRVLLTHDQPIVIDFINSCSPNPIGILNRDVIRDRLEAKAIPVTYVPETFRKLNERVTKALWTSRDPPNPERRLGPQLQRQVAVAPRQRTPPVPPTRVEVPSEPEPVVAVSEPEPEAIEESAATVESTPRGVPEPVAPVEDMPGPEVEEPIEPIESPEPVAADEEELRTKEEQMSKKVVRASGSQVVAMNAHRLVQSVMMERGWLYPDVFLTEIAKEVSSHVWSGTANFSTNYSGMQSVGLMRNRGNVKHRAAAWELQDVEYKVRDEGYTKALPMRREVAEAVVDAVYPTFEDMREAMELIEKAPFAHELRKLTPPEPEADDEELEVAEPEPIVTQEEVVSHATDDQTVMTPPPASVETDEPPAIPLDELVTEDRLETTTDAVDELLRGWLPEHLREHMPSREWIVAAVTAEAERLHAAAEEQKIERELRAVDERLRMLQEQASEAERRRSELIERRASLRGDRSSSA